MKNTSYFMLKVLLVHEIFTFLPWLFGYAEKRLDKKAKVDFNIYGVTDWATSARVFQIAIRGGEEFFYRGRETLGGVILTIRTFFKAKNSFL